MLQGAYRTVEADVVGIDHKADEAAVRDRYSFRQPRRPRRITDVCQTVRAYRRGKVTGVPSGDLFPICIKAYERRRAGGQPFNETLLSDKQRRPHVFHYEVDAFRRVFGVDGDVSASGLK